MKGKPTSFRFSPYGRKTLEALAKHWGIGMASVIEIALRDTAKAQGVSVPESAEKQAS